MENSQKKELTSSASTLAELNKYNDNYLIYTGAFDERSVAKDFELLVEFSKAYTKSHSLHRPSVGDSLQLPDGQTVYFCHIHDSFAQTCENGSFHLSNSGYISYSGGLDSGISLHDVVLTSSKSVLTIWFSHRGVLRAHCAIHANIESRVWKTKEGADLSGIPQIKRRRKRLLKEQAETIVKSDGYGRPYSEHLPEVVIIKENLPENLFQTIQQVTKLSFEDDYHYVPVYWCQPMTIDQLNKLKGFPQFTIREERDIWLYSPILVFEIKPE
ncbi:hypothetical protein ABIE26_002995 [Pedobacter africanus]|uniref:hypothetical protein n=1 Tax=Pedobacter africanus TaxID=151894 RepID=UPI0033997D48